MHLCQGDALLPRTDPEGCQKQLKKQQKNRVAAQRSRQKHTDKADALHQQHERLEKHNHALRKEIQALQAELGRWSRTLDLHERLCCVDWASHLAPGPAGCWGQTEQLLERPTPRGQHGCQEQSGLLWASVCSLPTQQLLSGPQPRDSAGCLCPSVLTIPWPPCNDHTPGHILPGSPTGSTLLGSSSKLSTLRPRSPAQAAPPQPLGLEPSTRGKLGCCPLSHCRASTSDGLLELSCPFLGLRKPPQPLASPPLLPEAALLG
ncbi:LOW QUALITY PROTEIN: basic leucine zipper transcriptional factor ATF-like 2 [Ctenodactylus gundi]